MKVIGNVRVIGISPTEERGVMKLTLEEMDRGHSLLAPRAEIGRIGGNIDAGLVVCAERELKGVSIGGEYRLGGEIYCVKGSEKKDFNTKQGTGKHFFNWRLCVDSLKAIAAPAKAG